MLSFHASLRRLALGGLCSLAMGAWAGDTTPQAQLEHWQQAAGAPASAQAGEAFFTRKHGREWACASCHHAPPTRAGQHAVTGKTLAPLAPAFNAKAFTRTRQVNKWFKRNCGDVLGRACTAQEKADVLAYLLSLKP